MTRWEARQIEVTSARLYAEASGIDRERVAVLLAGAAMQATTWEDEATELFFAAGVGVVRFDWRDIGQSTWAPFHESPYTIETLAEDVLAVAGEFGLGSFHLVGFSMGGCVAQLAALRQPERITSLALLASGYASVIDVPRPDRGDDLLASFAQPKPVNADEAVERQIEQWRLLCGRSTPFDEQRWRRRARAWIERGQNPSCPHVRLGPQVFGVDRRGQLEALAVPTIVIHGSDDPMFPYEHGLELARTLPDVTLELMEGRGHDLHLHPPALERVVAHIVT